MYSRLFLGVGRLGAGTPSQSDPFFTYSAKHAEYVLKNHLKFKQLTGNN